MVARWRGHVSLHDAFVAGIALVLAWVATLPGRPALRRPPPVLVAAALALTALGLLVRTLGIDDFPPPHGQLWEEAQMGHIADASIRDDALDHFFPLPNLLGETGLRLGGASLPALRAPFVAAGVAAVPVFLLAALALGAGRGAAIAATALFACSAYLSVSSRIALETHSPILTLCIALAACFYARRWRTSFAFALAGACSGLLMTEYTGYRLYPPLLAAMLALSVHADGRRAAVTRMALLLGCAVAVMLPVLVVPDWNPLHMLAEGILRHRGDMAAKGDVDWPTWAWALVERVRHSASFVFLRGSNDYLLPVSTGVVDIYTGLAAVAALACVAVRARRDAAAAFLFVAVVATVVLAGALTQNPSRYRLTPLPPLLFLAIAVAIDAVRRPLTGGVRRAATALVGAATAALCAVNLHLLVTAMSAPAVLAEFGDRALAVALEIQRLQQRFPGTIFVGTGETYMAESNDYSFLYDVERVRAVGAAGPLPDEPGILLVDEARGDEARRAAGAARCSMSEYRYGPESRVAFVVCELVARAAPP